MDCINWLRYNWVTIVSIVSPFAILSWMIRIVVTKKYSPPALRFEPIRGKGDTPAEVLWLVRITSEPLQGKVSWLAKRRDIQQARVQAQFSFKNQVVAEEFIDGEPDNLQGVNILANNTIYDFTLVFKSQGYPECRVGGWGGTVLPARADIVALVAVMEGQHTLGQSSFVIHNPDEHIANFSVGST